MSPNISIAHPANTLQRAAAFVLVALLLLCAAGTPAQDKKDKKKKKDDAQAAQTVNPNANMPDEEKIDIAISEMLGAWQLGDIEKMHQHIADDVSVVNGMWAPPIVGWPNYLVAYQQQRARTQQVRLDRTNTLVRVNGNFAWACYQWDFSGLVDGQAAALMGQTTLILEKRGDKWMVVHNHTSLVPASQPATPTNSPSPIAQPAKP